MDPAPDVGLGLAPRLHEAGDDAVVMNMTSSTAFVPFPITPTYNATRAALHSFSESLRVQRGGER